MDLQYLLIKDILQRGTQQTVATLFMWILRLILSFAWCTRTISFESENGLRGIAGALFETQIFADETFPPSPSLY